MGKKIFIALTFDLEMAESYHEELTGIIPQIGAVLLEEGISKATWMVRADEDIKNKFGSVDWVFQNHFKLIDKAGVLLLPSSAFINVGR